MKTHLQKVHNKNTSENGFALPSAIFLIVILALLAAFMVRISVGQQASSALDVQGVRAYHAAKAGLDIALYQILDPANTTVNAAWGASPTVAAGFPNLPACSTDVVNATIGDFTVNVNCTASTAGLVYHREGPNNFIRAYHINSVATRILNPTATIERRVELDVDLCRSLTGSAPSYSC